MLSLMITQLRRCGKAFVAVKTVMVAYLQQRTRFLLLSAIMGVIPVSCAHVSDPEVLPTIETILDNAGIDRRPFALRPAALPMRGATITNIIEFHAVSTRSTHSFWFWPATLV